MGLYSWFNDLGSFKKAGLVIGSCAVLCGTSYGFYKLYSRRRRIDLYDESPKNGQEHSPAVQKRVLVLGLQGCGKTTFLTALANLGSGIGGNEIKPTEGFNVMCVATNGVLLNIWESKCFYGFASECQEKWKHETTIPNNIFVMCTE